MALPDTYKEQPTGTVEIVIGGEKFHLIWAKPKVKHLHEAVIDSNFNTIELSQQDYAYLKEKYGEDNVE